MYHREKPIRFGFQFWVMATSDGTPVHFEPYRGREREQQAEPLETRVVKECVQHIQIPKQHVVLFDNLFCLLPLLEYLRERNIKAF